jgi:hypothetical protein
MTTLKRRQRRAPPEEEYGHTLLKPFWPLEVPLVRSAPDDFEDSTGIA